MRRVILKTLSIPILGFAVGIGLTLAAPATKKKTAPTSSTRKTAPKQAAGKGKTATKSTKSTYARSRGRGPQPVARRRSYGQQTPSQDRYVEIQQALISRGYMTDTPSGRWDAASADAMKRFQQDQNLPPSGKITSLSLIALGLGPKRSAASTAAAQTPVTP